MANRRQPTGSRRIVILPDLPNAFLVVTGAAGPGAVTVIPTPMAENYWKHPSATDKSGSIHEEHSLGDGRTSRPSHPTFAPDLTDAPPVDR